MRREGLVGQIGPRSFFLNSGSVTQVVASGGGFAHDLTPLLGPEVAWGVGREKSGQKPVTGGKGI